MILKVLKLLKTILDPKVWESIWMDQIKEEQEIYERPIILTPNDGSDWKRERW